MVDASRPVVTSSRTARGDVRSGSGGRARPPVLVALCLLAGCAAGVAADGPAAEVAGSVRAAERQRIETMRRAASAAVAIFAGDAGGGSGVLVSPAGCTTWKLVSA